MTQLVLSLFPGIGLLDHAFELEGFCVVRGPDVLWGGDVRNFHPPAGRFDGVIGGPPCQGHSTLRGFTMLERNGAQRGENLIPEFERVVTEAQPTWFLLENVRQAPLPAVDDYGLVSRLHDNHWQGETAQGRMRRFSMGLLGELPYFHIETPALVPTEREPAVLAGHGPGHGKKVRGIAGRNWQERARLQGVDPDRFAKHPLTAQGLQLMIGNGVPIPLGRAVARAVRKALDKQREVA